MIVPYISRTATMFNMSFRAPMPALNYNLALNSLLCEITQKVLELFF